MWMANRYWDCLKTLIPPEDAEYQPGKICNGKRLHYRNSGWKNNNITRLHHPHFHAWYVKSSKVYVKRPYQSIKMTSYLEEVLTSNEMYMINIFIINVVIKVQYDKEEG